MLRLGHTSGWDTPRLLVSQLCYQRPRQDSHLRQL